MCEKKPGDDAHRIGWYLLDRLRRLRSVQLGDWRGSPGHPLSRGSPALQDLMGRGFDYFMTLSPTAVPPVQSDLVKGIAVFRRERLASLPNLPTAFEQGMNFGR